MPASQIPVNEKDRIAVLHQYEVLDTIAEQEYQDIVTLASNICDVPISLISFVDCDRQWFKAKVGLDAQQTPRELAFCAYAIHDRSEVLVVPDAMKDERFADNDLVLQDPKIRFYAGAPIVTKGGQALGTLCVIDTKPRELSEKQLQILKCLARNVMGLIEAKHSSKLLTAQNECLEMAAAISNMGHWWYRLSDSKLFWSDEVYNIHGLTKDQYYPEIKSAIDFYHPDDKGRVQQYVYDTISQKKAFNFELRLVRNDGEIRKVVSRGNVQLDGHGEVEKVFGVFQDITNNAA